MAWAPKVVRAFGEILGEPDTVHTAIPPLAAGGELVDVAEFRRPDGTVVYATAGLSESGDWSAHEFLLHAREPDPRLFELLARLGGASRERSFEVGGTLPLDGPPDAPPPFDAVGFFYAGRRLHIGDASFGVRQVVGLTQHELAAARRDGLYTIEAAWDLDGVGFVCEPGRGTSPSLGHLTPVRPPAEEMSALTYDGRQVVDIAIHVDHEGAEGIRGYFTEDDARWLASVMGERLPHPTQLGCLLHALMDLTIPELATVCLRMLQLSPTDYMAGQYYADALAILEVIDGGKWDEAYFGYEADFEAACAAAEKRRAAAGLEIAYGLYQSPLLSA